MAKFIKYISLTYSGYGKKYPTYIITVPMKAIKEMGLENDRTIQFEYDDVNKCIILRKIKEQD